MSVPIGLIRRLSAGRTRDRARHRVKAGAHPIGAARSRLIRVLRHLRLYEAQIAARLRVEQHEDAVVAQHNAARLAAQQREAEQREERKAARRREDERFARRLRCQRLARLWQRERQELQRERLEFVLLLKEALADQTMTNAQREADQMAEQIVAWLTDEEPPIGV